MTAPRTTRTRANRRRRRRISTKSLVLLAVTSCVLFLIGRGTTQILSQVSCSTSPLPISVAVSTDIAPAIQRIADVFNQEQRKADGHCISVTVNGGAAAQTAALIDGRSRNVSQSRIDAWIPDSSLWVDEALRYPLGAHSVQQAGYGVARSPLVLVMPDKAAAALTPAFGKAGWRMLLPHSAGGPAEPPQLRVDLPDPRQNAAGLAALIEIGRMLGTGPASRVNFAKFAAATEVTQAFDDPVSLRSFVSLAAPPLNGLPITVTTEQAVLAYNADNPREPLAATYPTGRTAALGSPEFDYPYVLTTSNSLRLAAAQVFGRMLLTPYAQGVIRFAGFRSGSGAGVPDHIPASYGLTDQLLQVAPPAAATEEPSTLQAWDRLALSSRNLALVDVSAAMDVPANPADPSGPTLEQEMAQTASLGLSLFADSSSVGLWEFAAGLHGQLPYEQLVPMGPLTGNIGLILRRSELSKIAAQLTADGGPQVALYGSILDAYQYMQRTYQATSVNSVVVLTSGVENAPGDITVNALVDKLTKLEKLNPTRKVNVIIIIFGHSPIYNALQRIAHTTGGQAYQISKPSDVGKVFFRAVAHRLCDTNCVGA